MASNASYAEKGERYVELPNASMVKLLADLNLDDLLPEGARPVEITIYRRSINWPETDGIRLKLEWERNAVFLKPEKKVG